MARRSAAPWGKRDALRGALVMVAHSGDGDDDDDSGSGGDSNVRGRIAEAG